MHTPANRTGLKLGRRLFRILRVTGLALALCIVFAGLYLNRVGLPGFLKQRLIERLQAAGVEAEVGRIRLSWRGGVVAENVSVNGFDSRPGLRLRAATIELHPVWPARSRPHFALRRLAIQDGAIHWLVQPTNLPQKKVELRDLQIQTVFRGLERWTVRRCDASFAGVKLRLTGVITNASALVEPEKPRIEKATEQLELNLWRLAALFEQIRFDGVPVVHVNFWGDAGKPESFTGLFAVAIECAETPLCTLSNATLTLRVNERIGRGSEPAARLQLQIGNSKSKWVAATDASLQINWSVAETAPELLRAEVDLIARSITTGQIQADRLKIVAQCEHFATNPLPTCLTASVHVAGLKTRFGVADSLGAEVQIRCLGANNPLEQRSDLAWWNRLAALTVAGRVELGGVASTNLPVRAVACDFSWATPALVLSNLNARFDTGRARGRLGLDVATRRAEFAFNSDFDIRQLSPLLTEGTRRWFSRFDWETAPIIAGQGAVTLPAWTNRQPDWRTEVQPTLQLRGEVEVGPASYRGVEALRAHTRFLYSNMCWHLPELRIKRPEGDVAASIISSDVTREMYCRVEGDVDPGALRPVLDESTKNRLDLLAITQPACVKLELWGDRTKTIPRGIVGHVSLTNFTFRGERITSFWTDLAFTNQVLTFSNPVALCDQQFATAESVQIDFGARNIRFVNAWGNADPMTVARLIGPKTARAISPYQFLQPPNVRVSGTVPFLGTTGTDLVFEVDGGPFRWWRFNVAHVLGSVRWVDEHVRLNVAEADFYGAKLTGVAQFDFSLPEGAQLGFDTAFTNVNLQLLMQDLSPRASRLDGLLTGQLSVQQANTFDWTSWVGHGSGRLRDGYVWEFPMFSVLSPVLDAVIPGLGHSRFTDGIAHLAITNGFVQYGDLELRAPLLRMKLRGNVDFHGKVDARVEAELLRDTWLIGPVISTALLPLTKIFEYRLTGTITEPKAEPVYVPKLLLAPLQPMRLLKSLFPGNRNGAKSASDESGN